MSHNEKSDAGIRSAKCQNKRKKYLFQGIVAADFPTFFTGRFLEK